MKGQAVALVGMTMLLMFGAGGFLGVLSISDTVTETIDVNSGEIPVITEAKIRAEYYPERMRNSMAYGYNTTTFELGNDGAGIDLWTEDTSLADIDNRLEQDFLENMRGRNRIANCQGPSIDTTRTSTTTAMISLEGSEFVCTGEHTTASIPVSNIIRIEHYDNPFKSGGISEQGEELDKGMAQGSLDANEEIETQVEHNIFEASRSACESNVDDYEEELEEPAEEDAESDAESYYASSLVDFSNVEDEMMDRLSISAKVETLTGSISSERRVEEESSDCYVGCIPDGDGGCFEVYEDKIIADAEYDPSSAIWDIVIEDSEEIITAEGFVNLVLDYDYFQNL